MDTTATSIARPLYDAIDAQDERAAFEGWLGSMDAGFCLDRNPSGHYRAGEVRLMWEAWRAATRRPRS
jgi:hypothetical protein